MTEITARTPWAGHTGDVPLHLDYFEGTMFEALEIVAQKYPKNIAFDFMGKSTTYPQLIEAIKKCARSLKTIGVREGDKVTIAMPNCPQAIYMFYAVNLVGGIANMIHPLSAEKEIEFYLNESESVTAITLDQFYNKFESIRQNTHRSSTCIIASVEDALSKPVRGWAICSPRVERSPRFPRTRRSSAGGISSAWANPASGTTPSSAPATIPPSFSTPAAPPARPRASC